MTAGIVTNRGAAWLASLGLRGAGLTATVDDDTQLDLNGSSRPTFWIVLLNDDYGFTATNGRPNPDHGTLAEVVAAHPGCVIDPSGQYTGHEIPRELASFAITYDQATNVATITLASGFQPSITVTAPTPGIADVAGFALCTKNSADGTNVVLGIHGFDSPVVAAGTNDVIRITSLSFTWQPQS